jgi:secreted PhoX family phosphatase
MTFSRRDFLGLLGVAGVATQPLAVLAARKLNTPLLAFKGISPDFSDRLITAEGMDWKVLLRAGQSLGQDLIFGDGNDYLQFFPLSSENHGILWVNLEYHNPLFFTSLERTAANVEKEMKLVGGALVEIKKTAADWEMIEGSPYNRRLDAKTMIPFAGGRQVAGKNVAMGTFANCAGGVTPWGTVLTCEENYDMFYGERLHGQARTPSTWYGWDKFIDVPPEHYGWVVEVNPKTGEAKKHVTLGRFAHEAATVRLARDGRPVVYTGDDANDEFLYKFIASKKDSLEEGTLYVADTSNGRWLPLVHSNAKLAKVFKDQTEILVNCRQAGRILGATPLDRPEDIEIDPHTGAVLVATTNNKPKNRPHGKIIKITEKGNDPLSLTFRAEDYMVGGEAGGFACPDNLAFDPKGNLWFTTDMSGSDMHKGPLQNFGNNGLFVVMRTGPLAGMPVQMASAPIDSEFTGPLFSPDGKTLFLSVQHPGEQTKDLANPTSRWPDGKGLPRASVVTLQGPLLEKITRG